MMLSNKAIVIDYQDMFQMQLSEVYTNTIQKMHYHMQKSLKIHLMESIYLLSI